MNEWALITGASSGIGLELARLFAADKFNVVLVARNKARLWELADELQRDHGIQTKVLVQDLSESGAAQKIVTAVADTPISLLVNNAGFGFYGPFAESDLAKQTSMMQVNMTALVELTYLFLKPMLARSSGRILNVASTAAFQPGPWINVYYASKAFVHNFSYALADEIEGSGVTVTTLCPGTTHTDFFKRGNFGNERAPFTMDARTVAVAGYRGVLRGKRVVIPGWQNKIASALAKRLPLAITSAIVRRIHRKPGI
jgi:uncharacterized protein